jgi:hypothetical protein
VAAPISPQLSESRLVYGYNVATGQARSRIVFTSTSEILKHFDNARS